jgi:hypothetical protein
MGHGKKKKKKKEKETTMAMTVPLRSPSVNVPGAPGTQALVTCTPSAPRPACLAAYSIHSLYLIIDR